MNNENHFADVKISVPNGIFNEASVILNGEEIAHQTVRLELDLNANDGGAAIIRLSLLANITIDGKFKLVKNFEEL